MFTDKDIQAPRRKTPMHKKQGTECPEKNAKEVFLDYVIPDVGV